MPLRSDTQPNPLLRKRHLAPGVTIDANKSQRFTIGCTRESWPDHLAGQTVIVYHSLDTSGLFHQLRQPRIWSRSPTNRTKVVHSALEEETIGYHPNERHQPRMWQIHRWWRVPKGSRIRGPEIPLETSGLHPNGNWHLSAPKPTRPENQSPKSRPSSH